MQLAVYSLIVVWFHRVDHPSVRYPARPCYPHKHEPSFADMLSTLRCVSWEEEFRGVLHAAASCKKSLPSLPHFSAAPPDADRGPNYLNRTIIRPL